MKIYTEEEIMEQGDKVGSINENIEKLFDAVYNITHEFDNKDVIKALSESKCRGRELNKAIVNLIIKFQKGER